MATLLNRSFQFFKMALSRTDEGDQVLSIAEQRTVKGTIQPLNGQEAVTYLAGSRVTGSAKVYSSERLPFRTENSEDTAFVKFAGAVYELTEELPFQNVTAVSHFKYIASLVPPSQVPEVLK